jgi:hypothetical protein
MTGLESLRMNHPTRETIFRDAAKRLRMEFEDARNIPHSGERGKEGEEILKNFLNKHLPKRFLAGSGFIIDNEDNVSKQTDVIIDDGMNCPVYKSGEASLILPNDNVACVIEVKSKINKTNLGDAFENITKAKRLRKTPFNPTTDDLVITETLGIIFAFECETAPETIAENFHELFLATSWDEWQYNPNLVTILDKGIITTASQLPGSLQPSPAMIYGIPDYVPPDTKLHIVYLPELETTLDHFLRFLLAHLSFFRHRISHPGFDWSPKKSGAIQKMWELGHFYKKENG